MSSRSRTFHRRILDTALAYMNDDPVILLEGPRSVGKSTLLRQIASAASGRILDLDDEATQRATESDPSLMVGVEGLVCIDEYQKVPRVLDAIKAQLNVRPEPGRFVLTGSVRHEALPRGTQALTGRLSRLSIRPLSQGEIDGVHEEWLAAFMLDPKRAVERSGSSTTNRADYIERMVLGGFPGVLAAASISARHRWIDNYLGLSLKRDVIEVSNIRQPDMLPALINRIAGQTGQMLNVDKLARESGLDKVTAGRYLGLLEDIFLIYRLPAWGTTLNARAGKLPKVHMLDSAIAARMLRLTPAKLAALDPTTLSEFGHLLETFVVGELLKQASWLDGVNGLGHWRTHDGDEIDLIIERDDGGIAAFEVKSARGVSASDVKAMARLRDRLGASFLGGVVFYLGEYSYSVAPGLFAVPVDRLWTALS